ncbi:MAG: hypothetical protein ACFFCD_03730 [Promethearchaeota archaeon]
MEDIRRTRKTKVMKMYEEALNMEISSGKIEKLTELVEYLISELKKNGLI